MALLFPSRLRIRRQMFAPVPGEICECSYNAPDRPDAVPSTLRCQAAIRTLLIPHRKRIDAALQ